MIDHCDCKLTQLMQNQLKSYISPNGNEVKSVMLKKRLLNIVSVMIEFVTSCDRKTSNINLLTGQIDVGKLPLGIYLDLSKAFNMYLKSNNMICPP